MTTIYLTGTEPLIQALARASFPEYKGKKFQINAREEIDVRSCWSEGSRSYFRFVQVIDGAVRGGFEVPAQSAFDRPIPGADAVRLDSAPGLVCVEHSIFCGKDMGLRFHVHPTMLNAGLLPAASGDDLSDDERAVLYYTRAYKASYGGVSRKDRSKLSTEAWEAAKSALVTRGYLNRAGAITPAGRNAAQGLDEDYKTGRVTRRG